jgi:glycosyltransferase involved in cell wall biosynthesis
MKIVFIALHGYGIIKKEFPHLFGGAEVQLFLLANKLSDDHKYNVTFCTAADTQFTVDFKTNFLIHSCYNILKKGHFFKIVNLLRFITYLLRTNVDVYIQRNAGFETGLIALISKIRNKRFIYMVSHDIDCSGDYIAQNLIAGIFFKFGIKNANSIVVQHLGQKKILKENFNRDSILIPTAYPIVDNFHKESLLNRSCVLWVGRVIEWKNISALKRFIEIFPNIEFVIIGPIHKDSDLAIQEIKKLTNFLNVTYISKVPFEQIDDYFKRSKLFFNTSYHEGFPNTFVQALKNGVPIVSLYVNPDSMIDLYNLGVCSANENDIVKFMNKVYSDKNFYDALCQNCYTYAKKNHDINKSVQLLKGLLD